ncbi:multidrug transporter subunit MdtD [Celerinatantimonas sp. YJH-8]|uniref:multidrug transporter subunit MdtD n=1 Tax=Celerinatantimonas sp. YJH-8 TaxID=3228714 RepID=UPI0038C5B21D
MGKPTTGRALLWLVAMGFFMQTLDGTIVNTALPAMARSLHRDPLQMQQVVEAYLLTVAILIPASGWLADRFGTRNVFMFAIAMFGLGSLCCAESQTFGQLIVSRIIQGIGGSLLMPVGRLAILKSIPRREFLAAMSFVIMPGLLGPIIGPALGGLLVEIASWHWVFLINLPVAVVGIWVAAKAMPDLRYPRPEKFDYLGFLLLAGSMASLTVGLDKLAQFHQQNNTPLRWLAFGAILMAGYWFRAHRQSAPLFTPRLFQVKTFRLGALANILNRIGTGAMPLLIPLYLQIGQGFTPFKAGLAMIPIALAAMITKKFVVQIIHRFGYRLVLLRISLLQTLCIASFALTNHHPLWLIMQLFLLGTLNSITFSGIGTLALKELNDELASPGNSLLSVIQQLGFSFGIAVGGTLLAIYTQLAPAHQSILWSFNYTFISIAGIVLLPAFCYWRLPHDAPKQRHH